MEHSKRKQILRHTQIYLHARYSNSIKKVKKYFLEVTNSIIIQRHLF